MSFYDISKLPPIPVFDISNLPPLKDTGKNIVKKVNDEKKEILPILLPINVFHQAPKVVLPETNLLPSLPRLPQDPKVDILPPSANLLPSLPRLPQAPKVDILPSNANLLPIKNQQYTSELHLAPLSPRLSRNKTKIPKVVTKKVVPKVLEKTETCCICYDEEIPTSNLLMCKHPVCGECTGQLQKAECPLCKKYLEGPLVTDFIMADIINREEQAKNVDITANYLAGIYLREHPHANPEDVYDRYRN